MRIIPILIIFAMLLFPYQTFAETEKNEINLTTNPGKVLFDLSNLKPGDTVYRNLNIVNNGKDDFKYLASNKYISGSEEFYKQLDLKIEDNSGTIYKGKLFKLNKLDPRLLKSKKNEKLVFSIKVPNELGNEYQGLYAKFQFKLYVEGTLGGVLPADGPKLPETGTNMFNFMASGAILLIIGLIFQLFVYRRKKLASRN